MVLETRMTGNVDRIMMSGRFDFQIRIQGRIMPSVLIMPLCNGSKSR